MAREAQGSNEDKSELQPSPVERDKRDDESLRSEQKHESDTTIHSSTGESVSASMRIPGEAIEHALIRPLRQPSELLHLGEPPLSSLPSDLLLTPKSSDSSSSRHSWSSPRTPHRRSLKKPLTIQTANLKPALPAAASPLESPPSAGIELSTEAELTALDVRHAPWNGMLSCRNCSTQFPFLAQQAAAQAM